MPDLSANALMSIYDAALSPEHWTAALDSVSQEIGAAGSLLVAADQVGLPFRIEHFCSRYSADAVRHYFAVYGHHDEPIMTQRLAAAPAQQMLRDCDVWGNMSAIDDRPDYKWFREQYGIRRRAGVRLSGNKGWMDLLALQFDKDWQNIGPHAARKLEVLLPHLAKVVEINRRFTILRDRYKAVLTALDHVRIGTCVVAASGHVLVANREAQRIHDLDDGFSISKAGFLRLATVEQTSMFSRHLKAAALTAAGEGTEPEAVLFSQRRSGARPFLIEILPLRDSVNELENGFVGAIVFVIDCDNHRALSTHRLARLFGLTQAEAAVCRHMVEGLSAREIAELRTVHEDTVKSQFKAIYQKTGTRRRADLVRLAVTVDPPIGTSVV